MNEIIRYISDYARYINKKLLILCSLLTATLIFLNYHYHLSAWHYIFSFVSFIVPYFFYSLVSKKNLSRNKPFLLLLVVAPAVFSIKMSLHIELPDEYWSVIIYWPSLLVLITVMLFVIWKISDKAQPFYGLTVKGLKWKPYFIMLLCMIPLIAIASTQPDFLAMYPKLQHAVSEPENISVIKKILFELSYGSDFFTIELFFRGFLILAFIKWVGKDAILPMACFYCTIHFGKPLGECISSYFGGILLGIVVYNTRTIYGGLMVHLGIAWLMELGGYLGR